MENEATRRDQILYACSAQDPKLLPAQKSSQKQRVTQSNVPAMFDIFKKEK